MPKRPTGTSARALPATAPILAATHQDYVILSAVADGLVAAAGGRDELRTAVGLVLRDCIDGVIKTAKTGRRFYTDLEPTEKAHIGSCVEIDLRTTLELPKGPTQDL